MKRLLHIVCLIFLTTGGAFAQSAQDSVARSAQADHAKLLERENTMRKSLDSLQNMLNGRRTVYDAHPEWADSLSRDIIRLESDIFEMRTRLSRLGAQISAVETTIAKSSTPTPNRPARSLLVSQYFKENVSSKDMALFATTPAVMKTVSNIKREMDDLYARLDMLKTSHSEAKKQEELDQIINEATKLKAQIAELDARVGIAWGNLYNRRMDNYLVLVDRLGGANRTQLEVLDLINREVLSAENTPSLAPKLTAYNPQNKLLLNYETILAEKLNMRAAADSLKVLLTAPAEKSSYPEIAFAYRSLTQYSAITLNNTYPYAEVTDVPTIHIPANGAYYAIQVALTNAPASSLKIFKGGEPLQLERTQSGYYRYTLGGFHTYAEALSAYRQCTSAGFKSPTIVAWLNGTYTAATKVKAWEAANPSATASGHNIAITTTRSDIASILKTTIDINAPGKAITRSSNADGSFTFVISTFQSREEAQVIAEILRTKIPEAQIKIASSNNDTTNDDE